MKFFYVKLVKKPVFCRYLPRGAIWTSPSHIIFCSPSDLLSLCVLKYRVTMYNFIRCRGGGRVFRDINFAFSKNIDLVVLYRHAKTYCDIFTRFGDIDFFPLLHTSETTVHCGHIKDGSCVDKFLQCDRKFNIFENFQNVEREKC